jgi:hypothetical protein
MREQPHAWAWLMVPADVAPIALNWTTVADGISFRSRHAGRPGSGCVFICAAHAAWSAWRIGRLRWRWSAMMR